MLAGSIVYHGPKEGVLDFFESQGFSCPPAVGAADFLQEVTSRKDQQASSCSLHPQRLHSLSLHTDASCLLAASASYRHTWSDHHDQGCRSGAAQDN